MSKKREIAATAAALNSMKQMNGVLAVSPREKENIRASALAFVFAWHRTSAIGAYEQQHVLKSMQHR